MSNRSVREPSQALAQRLAKIEERLRAMSLRTWPGAVRTASAPDQIDIAAEDATQDTVVLTMQVLPGRWAVFGQTSLVMPTNAVLIDFRVNVFVVDPETAQEPDDCVCDVLQRRLYITDPNGAHVADMTLIGNVSSERIVDVQLTVSNAAGDAFYARQTHLLLMPV